MRPLLIGSVLAVAALLTGCATNTAAPGEAPQSPTPTPTEPSMSGDWTASPPSLENASVVWLDGGKALGVVTWGSGSRSCYPVVQDVTVANQDIDVVLAAPTVDGVCTQDLREQLLLVGLPEGVDSKAAATVTLSTAQESQEIALAARPADAATTPAGELSATLTPLGVVLISYGSSSCPPVVDTIDGTTVTFTTIEQACTMDYSPRATLLDIPDAAVGTQLNLVSLDGAADPVAVTVQN